MIVDTDVPGLRLGTYQGHVARRKAKFAEVEHAAKQIISHKGVLLHISAEEADPLRADKVKLLKDAVSLIIKYSHLPAAMHVYLTHTSGNDSAGYVDSGKSGKTMYRMFLGENVGKYRELNAEMPAEAHREMRGGYGPGNGLRIVADQVYDKATFGKRKKLILAAILHEFGHVLHAAVSPLLYLQQVEDIPLVNSKTASAEAITFHKRLATLGKKVSFYGAKNPLEYVAEVFSGLLSGLSYDKDVWDAYLEAGGPPLPIRTRSTGKIALGDVKFRTLPSLVEHRPF